MLGSLDIKILFIFHLSHTHPVDCLTVLPSKMVGHAGSKAWIRTFLGILSENPGFFKLIASKRKIDIIL